ncbi:MAG: mechanosensitive ion channel family protein, partial [Porticoccaceae bacterium]|nr:mechanosensitive ion channel family protein [Porticoccaceae bacterium]
FYQFAPSSVDFFVYTFTVTTDWVYFHQVKQDVLLRIAEVIAAEDAEIAFPTRTLAFPENSQVATLARGDQA